MAHPDGMDIKRHTDERFFKRTFHSSFYTIMRHLNIPRFAGHNKVLPSPTSTTHSNQSVSESDESDIDSPSSITSMDRLVSLSGISQLHSVPTLLANSTPSNFHCRVHHISGGECNNSICTSRASVFRERFDLLELYPRDPFRRTIYQGESFSEPAMNTTYGFGPRRMSRENSVQKIAYMFRSMMGVSRDRKL
jgi:hypothetical protein